MDSNRGEIRNNQGIGALSLLGVVFVTLKLVGVIVWSWWWVTLPFWGELGLLGLIVGVLGIAVLGKRIYRYLTKRKFIKHIER